MSEDSGQNRQDGQNTLEPGEVRFDAAGLVPAVMRDARRRRVLTLAYMNLEALEKTTASGEVWFWSRSRGELWHKGATSGNRQRVVSMCLDCDNDAILVDVEALGPACHSGAYSCFGDDDFDLARLEEIVRQRKRDMPEGSYVAKLFAGGRERILKKIGEEATELVIAASSEGRGRLVSEAADLVFHLVVLLENEGLSIADVEEELARRHRPAAL
ncbi:MAG TPA: bifunctional phosphoribosyl-AMP cyclohydrolase/phosphoribosyl-ATP diphosphatase HisIE [Thermoanaerobaculia bacterium]|nr:bifunctional phosphoribosyl-AMP cyclohydrolase/phosphoribosyl-ATP diphosphatase HisIE [Thermoanaerobaculia bacterium]